MDVRIEAAPIAADVQAVTPTVSTVVTPVIKAMLPELVLASTSCPSMGSHSISAVAPDHILEGGTALAAA